MDIPAEIAANAAMTRQAIGLQIIKKNAEADKAIASMLEQSANNVAALAHRGTNVNFSV